MSIKVKLFLGEQDGLVFSARTIPDVMWIMTYEARKMVEESRRLGIDIDEDDEPLPRLPYRLSSVVQLRNGEQDALYRFDESLLYPESEREALPGEDASQ